MTPQKTTVPILAMLFASLAVADEFKTINGKDYKDVTVSRVEPDGIVLKSKTGITKVYFTELPKDVEERFHHDSTQDRHSTTSKEAIGAHQNAALGERRLGETADQFAARPLKNSLFHHQIPCFITREFRS